MSAHSISKKNSWLTVKNYFDSSAPVELLIQGPIGTSFWDESGTSEKDFTNALREIPEGKDIVVGINSEGGSVKDGLGIYHAILRRGERVTTRVDGYAVSIASVIALAGAKRVSPESSIWMIHEPWSVAAGNSEDMRKEAAALDAHADAIVAVYKDRTKLTAEDARAKMKAETWFRGNEAVELGFATEAGTGSVALNTLDATKYRNVPKDILRVLAAAAPGNQPQPSLPGNMPEPATQSTQPEPTAAATISGNGVVAGGTGPAASTTTNMERTVNMPDTTTTAAVNPPATAPAAAIQPQATQSANTDQNTVIVDLKNQITDLAQAVKAMTNPPVTGTARATVTREGLNDLLAQHKTPKARFEFLRDNWRQLQDAGIPLVHNANTDSASGALTPGILANGFITVLQNRLAPLAAFARNFSDSAMVGRRNVLYVPIVKAGGTAGSNATSFEDTTNFVNTVDDVPVTPAHITVGAHITLAERESGWLMAWWAEQKAAEMADKIQALVNAVITTTNFGTLAGTTGAGAPLVSSSAAFGASDLRTLWGYLKKSPIKNVMLDGEYYAKFIPADMNSFNPLATNSYPGWDGFFCNTNWTGATTNVVGFACNPQAIAVAAALPEGKPPSAANLAQSTIAIGNGMSIQSNVWYSNITRTEWWTMDVMFGAKEADTTAGTLVMSA